MNRKLMTAGILIVAALITSFLLRDVVEQVIIRPVIYLFWVLGILYSYIPQPFLWLVLVLVMIYAALGRLASNLEQPGSSPHPSKRFQGPVDALASQIERKEGGIYFKWQIARNLGQIAMDIQEIRLHIHSRTLHDLGKPMPAQVRRYLDSGLNTSFSDYPLPRSLPWPRWLKFLIDPKNTQPPMTTTARSTPFDGDISPVIDYLETEMENDDDLRRA